MFEVKYANCKTVSWKMRLEPGAFKGFSPYMYFFYEIQFLCMYVLYHL